MAADLFAKNIARKIFLEDWGLKLLALVITIGLWLIVNGLSTPMTKRLTVPFTFNIPSNAQVTNIPVQQVEIEITGDKRRVEDIRSSDLVASLDLSEMKPGNWVLTLTPDTVNVPLPQGVKLGDIAPGRIPVNIEAVEEKEVEVRAETVGRVAAGFEIYTAAVLPPRITIRGPASVVRVIEYLQTDEIDIAGKREEFTARQVAVSSPNPQAAILNTVVDVVFRIGETRIERVFTLPVSGEAGKTATFAIYGPKTWIARLRADDLKVEMFLDGDGELKPHVILPEGTESVAEVSKLRLN